MPSNYVVNRPRPAGPSGYEKGFNGDSNYYYGHYDNPRGALSIPRFPPSPNNMQGNRQNFRVQDRSTFQDQYRNSRTGMSALTTEQNFRVQHRPPYQDQFSELSMGMSTLTIEEGVRTRQPIVRPSRMPSAADTLNTNNQFVQNKSPPAPPSKWIERQATGNAGMIVRQQDNVSAGTYEKPIKKVYQVKMQHLQDSSDPGSQQWFLWLFLNLAVSMIRADVSRGHAWHLLGPDMHSIPKLDDVVVSIAPALIFFCTKVDT